MFDNFYGVWANKDCELVRTSKFSIFFERTGDTISATIKLLNIRNNKIIFETRAIVFFDSANKQVTIKARDLLSGEKLLVDNGTDNKLELVQKECIVENTPRKIIVKCGGEITEELMIKDNELKLHRSKDKCQTLNLVEKIDIVEPYQMRFANEDNIGACLQEWGLGTGFEKDDNGNHTIITITTNKHSYTFGFGKWKDMDYIYCRAARIRSNNNGTVFVQNIRLMKNPREFTAFMPDNNFEITRKSIVIDNSLFNPDVCTFTKSGIYWSLKSYDKNLITLHGCGEEEYQIGRSEKNSEDILEWFEYKNDEE